MQKSKCPFCNMELNFINPSHLKKHNIKMYEFKKKFPNICVCSDAFKEHLKSISGNSLGKHSSIEAGNYKTRNDFRYHSAKIFSE